MHCCYGWELCVSLFMAPSDSQHPEIEVRVKSRRRRRKRWRKPNKTNIEATLHQLGLGRQVGDEEMVQDGKSNKGKKQGTDGVKGKVWHCGNNKNKKGPWCEINIVECCLMLKWRVLNLSWVLIDLTTDDLILFPIALTFDLGDFPSWSKSNKNEGSSSPSATRCMWHSAFRLFDLQSAFSYILKNRKINLTVFPKIAEKDNIHAAVHTHPLPSTVSLFHSFNQFLYFFLQYSCISKKE